MKEQAAVFYCQAMFAFEMHKSLKRMESNGQDSGFLSGLIPESVHGKCSDSIIDQELLEEAFGLDESGDSALHDAIRKGDLETVYSLVNLAPNGKYLSILNKHRRSPLHVAVLRKQPWAVRRLVIAGALVGARDRRGNTPLHLACALGERTSLDCLTTPVSDEESRLCSTRAPPCLSSSAGAALITERNDDGLTPLHLAAIGGFTDSVARLVSLGADVDEVDGLSGRSALHLCAAKGDSMMCMALMELGADLRLVSWDESSAADVALCNGFRDLAELLCVVDCDESFSASPVM
ncbi:unnamed protein product [Notodromas monacha]|uniref:Uncharacterized protein n=1 Tax=Notodromas monacha TaxID=399045 RepID=A0A7R9BN38_9CRUS|nr:unnamed protein product [Notodromas monacha]CAG0917175.1 unnamed protein product [Notodromas monacha]